jgi:multidrug resistance efflux pump
MWTKYGLPLLGVVCLVLAVLHSLRAQAPRPAAAPPVEPPRAPWAGRLAATGVVEAQTENIALGSPLSGVVAAVSVQPGQTVQAGAELFRLDDRSLRAELKVGEANLASARAQLVLVESRPRAEELPPSEARVREAEAQLAQQLDRLRRSRQLLPGRAIPEQELVENEQTVRAARELLTRARAEHDLLRAGASEAEKGVARAAVAQAEALLEQTRTELERLCICAPGDGTVLRVHVHRGEYVAADAGQALVVFGNLGTLHVRAAIDEHDIPRFHPGAEARATLRGRPDTSYPLNFVRIEPYVVPKKSLSGEGREQVDTRVLHVLYAVQTPHAPLHVGQQVEVFIASQES